MIPKIIHQSYTLKDFPKYINICSESWIEENVGWDYRISDSSSCEKFVNDFFPEYYDIYMSINIPAYRSDFWRLLCLKQYGGFYFDIDMLCVAPIENFISLDRDFVWIRGNGAFGCIPNSKLISSIISSCVNEIRSALKWNKYSGTPIFYDTFIRKAGGAGYSETGSDIFIDYSAGNYWSDNNRWSSTPHLAYWYHDYPAEISVSRGYGSYNGYNPIR